MNIQLIRVVTPKLKITKNIMSWKIHRTLRYVRTEKVKALICSMLNCLHLVPQAGVDTKTAGVGDPLSMIFEILDIESPYEIFVRDLVALDGATGLVTTTIFLCFIL